MTAFREVASRLRFPEGPVALPDGSVLVVEIAAGQLTRIAPDGAKTVVAALGGGPNGAAIGPDGKCYVCNNGGFEWRERDGRLLPLGPAADYAGGSIQRVDLATGAVETLYEACDGERLKGPNDLVFDGQGGFWFTDHGKMRKRDRDITGVLYARADGSAIREAIFPMEEPNGIALSPADDRLYVAETTMGRVWAYELAGPGEIRGVGARAPLRGAKGMLLASLPGYQLLDSMAVDSAGNLCLATLINGGITVVSPGGRLLDHVSLPDRITTNICFGGPELRTAYITLATTGRLIALEWPRPGLGLHHLNR